MTGNGSKQTTLEAIAKFTNGGAWNQTEYSDEGVPVVRVTDIKNETVDLSDCKFLPKSSLGKYAKHLLRAGDLVICTVGSHPTQPGSVVGRAAVMPDAAQGALLNQNAVCIRSSSPDVDQGWLGYLGRSRKFHDYIISCARGSANQVRMAIGLLKEMPIEAPPLSVQRRIAGILSAYDELMENSQRRIRLLEAMARALYRECIREADTAFAKSILESDYWKFISVNVSPYEGTKRYYATADIEKLAIEGAGIDYTFAEKPSRAQKQPTPFSVWFARMKDTYKIAWYSNVNSQSANSSVLSSGFAGFQAIEPAYFPVLFLTVSSQEFHAQKDLFCSGATQMSLTNEGLSRIRVPVLGEEAVQRLGEQALPLLNQMIVLQLQIQNLRRTRDLLLPRLLSGQVELKMEAA